jgi:excisionase family DNA binding protein
VRLLLAGGLPVNWPYNTQTNEVEVPDQIQEAQRQKLLGMLFGSDVPQALEGQLLRTSDVALLFEVSERTVSEWAKKGQIPSVRTPGGHRRYPAEGIRWMLDKSRQEPNTGPPPSASVTPLNQRHSATA